MKPITMAAVLGILLAAALYTTAAFSERRARLLKGRHLALFWAGLAVDTAATALMTRIAGGLHADLHGLLGVGAILVMLGHTLWATAVLVLHREGLRRQFHTFSLTVWALWMVTLVSGFALALPRVVARSRARSQVAAVWATPAGSSPAAGPWPVRR